MGELCTFLCVQVLTAFSDEVGVVARTEERTIFAIVGSTQRLPRCVSADRVDEGVNRGFESIVDGAQESVLHGLERTEGGPPSPQHELDNPMGIASGRIAEIPGWL